MACAMLSDTHFDEVVDTYLDENLKEVMQDDEVMDEDMQELVEQIDTESEEHRNASY